MAEKAYQAHVAYPKIGLCLDEERVDTMAGRTSPTGLDWEMASESCRPHKCPQNHGRRKLQSKAVQQCMKTDIDMRMSH